MNRRRRKDENRPRLQGPRFFVCRFRIARAAAERRKDAEIRRTLGRLAQNFDNPR